MLTEKNNLKMPTFCANLSQARNPSVDDGGNKGIKVAHKDGLQLQVRNQ